jgi:hypothetical protein
MIKDRIHLPILRRAKCEDTYGEARGCLPDCRDHPHVLQAAKRVEVCTHNAAGSRKRGHVFFQVGLLTTIGLSAKNAILIVEFAKENFEKGMNLVGAAKHAAAQRLRPILMTSFAFVMGVMPLAISSGAGSGGQNATILWK